MDMNGGCQEIEKLIDDRNEDGLASEWCFTKRTHFLETHRTMKTHEDTAFKLKTCLIGFEMI